MLIAVELVNDYGCSVTLYFSCINALEEVYIYFIALLKLCFSNWCITTFHGSLDMSVSAGMVNSHVKHRPNLDLVFGLIWELCECLTKAFVTSR